MRKLFPNDRNPGNVLKAAYEGSLPLTRWDAILDEHIEEKMSEDNPDEIAKTYVQISAMPNMEDGARFAVPLRFNTQQLHLASGIDVLNIGNRRVRNMPPSSTGHGIFSSGGVVASEAEWRNRILARLPL